MLALTDEQRMIRDTAAELARNEFAADAFGWDGSVPWENLETLADRGLLGANFSEEYGGGGLTEFEVLLITEAIGRVCPDTAEAVMAQSIVAPRAIDMFGSETVKERYLPRVADGTGYVSIAISEPEAGSDVKSMTTTVTEENGDLVLNGEKTWVSFVPDADAAVVWAKFPDGMGTLVLDFDAAGIEVANHYTNMAGHPQTHFYMEDVHVPEENVLTRGEDGFRQNLKSLNWERLGSAAFANAMARCALEHAFDYAEQREQFGQSIAEFQGIEWKFADMVTELQISRTLTFSSAQAANEQGRVPEPLNTSIAKLYSTQMADRVVSEALQIHGANGYQQGHPMEELYRKVRGYRIAGGTDEIMKNTIARLFKKQGIEAID